MNLSAQRRRKIAATVAAELLCNGTAQEAWLEGALACGFAHAASDIDLRGIVDTPPSAAWESQIVNGIRVDLQASTPEEINNLRALLSTFDVRRDHLPVFRQARSTMPALRDLRTALSYDSGCWQPVLTEPERDGYRRWAVADQAEIAASLTEDLMGLLLDELAVPVEVTSRKLEMCLLALARAAAGHPVLGDKWLPLLGSATSPLPIPRLTPSTPGWLWFRPVQRQVTKALLSCWPVQDRPGRAPDLDDPGAGWLPQYYADGWFLRLGDTHVPVSGASLLAWYRSLGSTRT
ncbi:hypothetical protein [Streptomyces sp. NPDC002851]